MYLFKFISIVLVLFSTSCVAPWNPQGYAGINKAEIHLENGVPTFIVIWSGKENETSRLKIEMPNGLKAEYTAGGVKAFKAHEIRAAVEKQISKDMKDVSPDIVEKLVKSIMGLPF